MLAAEFPAASASSCKDVLCGQHQRALPSGLPPLAGEASSADSTRGTRPSGLPSIAFGRDVGTSSARSVLLSPQRINKYT